MKALTTGLVAAALALGVSAPAQYWPNASVSGTVLSMGPLGFMLAGPDGNYGIQVSINTFETDPWQGLTTSGAGLVQPGMVVTAFGYPTGQWTMQATRVVVQESNMGYGYPGPAWSYPSWTYGAPGLQTFPPTGGVIQPMTGRGITIYP